MQYDRLEISRTLPIRKVSTFGMVPEGIRRLFFIWRIGFIWRGMVFFSAGFDLEIVRTKNVGPLRGKEGDITGSRVLVR